MTSTNVRPSSHGLYLAAVVLSVFVILKLTHAGTIAHLSWPWVLSPLWGFAGLIAAIALIALSLEFVWLPLGDLIDSALRRRHRKQMTARIAERTRKGDLR